jgi:hypothetical protein
MIMRIILQDRQSLLYFKGFDEWTDEIEEARDFRQVVSAIDYVQIFQIPNLDVVMNFGDPKFDVRAPVTR